MTQVTIRDMVAAGVCTKARTRKWFASHGLDFRDFVRNGIDAEDLLATNDNMSEIRRVVAIAEKREAE